MINLQEALKKTAVYFAIKDLHSKYVYCNEACARHIGLDSPQDIIGKSDLDLFPIKYAKKYRSGDDCVLRGGLFVNVPETLFLPKKTIPIFTTKNQLRNRHNAIIGVSLSFIESSHLLSLCEYQEEKISTRPVLHEKNTTVSITNREYQVLIHATKGWTNKQIAQELGLSHRTIEEYIDTIKMKLGCVSKHDIYEYAIKVGIISHQLFL